MNRFESFVQIIEQSTRDGLFKQGHGLSGFSGEAVVGTLQRLAQYQAEEGVYLEVGVFQGLTLISTACVLDDNSSAFGIDNFSQFDPQNKNQSIVEERIQKNGLRNVFLINEDFEDALEKLSNYIKSRPVGLYFVDGPHDYRSQIMCLLLALPYLSPQAVIIVDDCNYRHVRQANRDFLMTHPEFKLLFESYTPRHPSNMSDEELQHARKGWWNGVNVIVRDPENQLTPFYPECDRDRTLYFNDHLIHPHRFALATPQALDFITSLTRLRWIRAVRILRAFLLSPAYRLGKKRYRKINTDSHHLSPSRFNPSVEL